MPDRVDDELRRISTALAEVSPRRPELPGPAKHRRSPQLLVATVAFVGVLGLGLAAGLLFGSQDQVAPGLVPIPEDHPAHQILAQDGGPDVISALSAEMGFQFVCGQGAGNESCVVWEDGVAVIIPYRVSEGATAEVRTPAHDGPLEIPLEVGEPVAAVRHDTGLFTLVVHVPGHDTPFSYGTYFPPSSAP